MNIPPEVRQSLHIQPGRFLGGRLNWHWLATREGETLVLRRWHAPQDVACEGDIRSRVAALGWPVPLDASGVVQHGGHTWSLMTFLPGAPHVDRYSPAEQRQRGRLLAEFHLATADLDLPQRPGWRTAPETLNDPDVERVFQAHPDAAESHLYLWHLAQARELAVHLDWASQPRRLIHGDFTPWNLLFEGGRLSGLLDFELSHVDYLAAEFCLSWRGQYDGVIHAYHEVSPLSDFDRQALTPLWWASLLELAYSYLQRGQTDDGWVIKMLLRRSPLVPVRPYNTP